MVHEVGWNPMAAASAIRLRPWGSGPFWLVPKVMEISRPGSACCTAANAAMTRLRTAALDTSVCSMSTSIAFNP